MEIFLANLGIFCFSYFQKNDSIVSKKQTTESF